MHYKEVKAILSPQNGINIYRGCLHGCIYCDSRSTCYHMDHDFEDIEVKAHAADLLEKTLKSKRRKGMIGTGSMTDPYLPLEAELKVMRQCLVQIERFEFGVAIHTKSDLILRDLDLLEKINKKTKCVVQITLTTYDDELCKILEPNVCVTSRRVEVLKELQKRGIPTVVWISPILPFINDTRENIEGLLRYCVDSGVYGVMYFGAGMTLRDGDRQYYYGKLDEHFPGLKDKYIETYGNDYEVVSPNSKEINQIVYNTCEDNGIIYDRDELMRYMREYKNKTLGTQMSFFDFMD